MVYKHAISTVVPAGTYITQPGMEGEDSRSLISTGTNLVLKSLEAGFLPGFPL